MPVKISGSAAGSRMRVAISRLPSFSTRPVLTRIGRTLRTALIVNKAIGMMPWMAPNATLADMPRPNDSSRIG